MPDISDFTTSNRYDPSIPFEIMGRDTASGNGGVAFWNVEDAPEALRLALQEVERRFGKEIPWQNQWPLEWRLELPGFFETDSIKQRGAVLWRRKKS